MSWLNQLVPPPETRGPLTLQSFVEHILLTFCGYYATALLVVLPDTFPIRLALLPLTLWSAFRAATSIDMSLHLGPDYAYLNYGLVLAMIILAMRLIEWTFYREPLRRRSNDKDSDATQDLRGAAWDALDLFFNLRGCGWEWSKGLQVPEETRPIHSPPAFALATLLSLVKHVLYFDTSHFIVQSFSPTTIGSSTGGTIFDPSKPPALRYLCAIVMAHFGSYGIYCGIQSFYDLATLVGVLVFRHSPAQWPPLFGFHLGATSLGNLWAKRWHQMFRQSFICLGGNPLQFLLGRFGGVLGAFLVSGVLHDWGMWGMGKGTEFSSVGGYFLMNGVGIILEAMWKKATGYKIGGWRGQLWTVSWATCWASILVDAWARRGLYGSTFIPDAIRPTKIVFDAVHTYLTT